MHLSPPLPRPRILHLTQPVDGGVARVVADLVRAQLAGGMEVAVACPDSPLAASLRALGADVRRWEATRSPGPGLAAEVRRLARIVRELAPGLVHAHSAKAGLAGRLAVRGRIPTVFQPHAWSFEAVGGLTAALALRWERRGARWAARTVCVSEAERATGVRAGIDGRWAVIPNGIDLEHFRPAEGGGAVRSGLAPLAGVAPDAPLAVCVGRLCRQKGQDVLLRAWETVVRRVPGARLVLVGDGPDHDRLREVAPESVVFAGAVADTRPWYRAADVVVLPSRWEGMALAPLEAMACGAPVIVTDVDGARESLPSSMTSRCLVPPESPAVLAGAVSELLLDPALRASLGDRARRHVRSAHDVRHTAAAVAAVYRELLPPRPRSHPAVPAASTALPATALPATALPAAGPPAAGPPAAGPPAAGPPAAGLPTAGLPTAGRPPARPTAPRRPAAERSEAGRTGTEGAGTEGAGAGHTGPGHGAAGHPRPGHPEARPTGPQDTRAEPRTGHTEAGHTPIGPTEAGPTEAGHTRTGHGDTRGRARTGDGEAHRTTAQRVEPTEHRE